MNFLVVGNGVEEVVVAGVKARMYHGSSDTKHTVAARPFWSSMFSVTLVGIFDLGGEGVSSRDGSCTSIVSTGTVLRVSSVMASRYCNNLSQSSTKEGDLEESEGGDVNKFLNSHTYECSHSDTMYVLG